MIKAHNELEALIYLGYFFNLTNNISFRKWLGY